MKSSENKAKVCKRRLFLILAVIAYLTFMGVITIQVSYSSYTSRLASSGTSVRVANWSVNVTPATTAVYVSSSASSDTESAQWSNTYRVDIINDSEVLACYGHSNTADSGDNSYHSILSFNDFPDGAIEGVKFVSAKTGEAVLVTSAIQNNSISFIMDGTLNPGETLTYYVQFAAGDIDTYEYSKVTVNADFTFQQAFETTTENVSVK